MTAVKQHSSERTRGHFKNSISKTDITPQNPLQKLDRQHYELMQEVRDYWMTRALRSGANLTIEDIREDVNWFYERVGDMGTTKPHIFMAESYAEYQLMYNLLKLVNDNRQQFAHHGKGKTTDIFETAAMDRVWDVLWYGTEGPSIHEVLDKLVRKEVQDKIWDMIAREAGNAVGINVWDVVRQNLVRSIRETQWKDLWEGIGSSSGRRNRLGLLSLSKQKELSSVTAEVYNHAMQPVMRYTTENLDIHAREEIENIVEGLVKKNTAKLEFVDHFIGLGNWAGWVGFYDFFYQAGILTPEQGLPPEFLKFRAMIDKGVWTMAFYNDCCLVCKLPTVVRREDVTRSLHATEAPAIEWRDGTGQYFLHGVNFSEQFVDNLGAPPMLWQMITEDKMGFADIFGITNIEQRYVALRIYGPQKMIKDAKAELIHRSRRGNELYKVPGGIVTRDKNGSMKITPEANTTRVPDNTVTVLPEMRMLKYTDPSIGRVYVSFVPETFNDADESMAWKHNMSKEEYEALTVEA